MKKVLILLLCCFSLSLCAQEIIKDNVDSEGTRTVIGELVNVRSFTDEVVFNVGVCGFCIQGRNSVSLMIRAYSSNPYKINKGMSLLLKTFDDEVLTLKADVDANAMVRDVHNVNGFVYSDYSTIQYYNINSTDAQKIMKGIKKMRVESTQGAWDKNFKKDKIGAVVKAEYPQIKLRLAKEKSFSDGF